MVFDLTEIAGILKLLTVVQISVINYLLIVLKKGKKKSNRTFPVELISPLQKFFGFHSKPEDLHRDFACVPFVAEKGLCKE